jgi:hypothetical protein
VSWDVVVVVGDGEEGLRVCVGLWWFVSHTCHRDNIFPTLSLSIMPS